MMALPADVPQAPEHTKWRKHRGAEPVPRGNTRQAALLSGLHGPRGDAYHVRAARGQKVLGERVIPGAIGEEDHLVGPSEREARGAPVAAPGIDIGVIRGLW